MDDNKLLELLEGIISIKIKDKEGNLKVVYEKYMEGINDKVKS